VQSDNSDQIEPGAITGGWAHKAISNQHAPSRHISADDNAILDRDESIDILETSSLLHHGVQRQGL